MDGKGDVERGTGLKLRVSIPTASAVDQPPDAGLFRRRKSLLISIHILQKKSQVHSIF